MSGGDSISNIKQSNEREMRYEKALRVIRSELVHSLELPIGMVSPKLRGIMDFIGDALYE